MPLADRLPGRPRPMTAPGAITAGTARLRRSRIALRAAPNGLICARYSNGGRSRRDVNIRQGLRVCGHTGIAVAVTPGNDGPAIRAVRSGGGPGRCRAGGLRQPGEPALRQVYRAPGRRGRKQPRSVTARTLAWRSTDVPSGSDGAARDGSVRRTSAVCRIDADGPTADGCGVPCRHVPRPEGPRLA